MKNLQKVADIRRSIDNLVLDLSRESREMEDAGQFEEAEKLCIAVTYLQTTDNLFFMAQLALE